MGGAKGNHFEKEPYMEPTWEPKSVLDVAALIRDNLLERHEADKVPLSMEELARPILLVEDYAGHVHSIKEAIQKSGMQCHVGSVVDGLELSLVCGAAGAVHAHVLLLDLRQFKDLGSNVLLEIGEEPHLRRIPLVILANSAADSQISKDSNRHNLWRLTRPVDSEQCMASLRSLLDLQMAILRLPPKGKQKDGGADTRSSKPKEGGTAATGVAGKTDWEVFCREIK